ncbi:unnamed protein product [[Candida] boidinii]|nr:unnamed protein product [[Candida] boidinii]
MILEEEGYPMTLYPHLHHLLILKADFADDEQQWGDGNYDCDNDDEYSIGRNDIGELKSIKSLDENSSLYFNDTNNIVAIPAVETEKSVDDEEDDDNDVIASDKLDTLDLEIKKIDSVAKSELDNDDTSSISKSKGKKNMVTFADSDDVENQKDSDGNDADDDRKDQVDDATILAKSTIFDTNKLIGRSLWGKMKKAFRYTPILNKSSLSGLSSNEDNQTDFGEITENNDNATIVDGNESSNESVYLPRDSETRFNGFKRFANHITETFENVGSGDSYDIRSPTATRGR